MNDIIFKTILLKGDAGNNIGTIEKTATSGLVDTYTITLTDGATTNFQVTNGSNIASVQKTATAGLVDTYTITLTNGDTFNFEVVNGADGANINLAPTERGDTANQSYKVGEHLVTARDGYYYKVTKPISVGDALLENTNIEKKYVSEEIEELFQSVSSGKSVVAGAITDKGVQTASNATFATLAQNIANIPNHNSGTYTVSDDGSYDMGEANTYRFVNVSTPNHNSGTYTVSDDGIFDMGEANSYRYVSVSVPSNIGSQLYNNHQQWVSTDNAGKTLSWTSTQRCIVFGHITNTRFASTEISISATNLNGLRDNTYQVNRDGTNVFVREWLGFAVVPAGTTVSITGTTYSFFDSGSSVYIQLCAYAL